MSTLSPTATPPRFFLSSALKLLLAVALEAGGVAVVGGDGDRGHARIDGLDGHGRRLLPRERPRRPGSGATGERLLAGGAGRGGLPGLADLHRQRLLVAERHGVADLQLVEALDLGAGVHRLQVPVLVPQGHEARGVVDGVDGGGGLHGGALGEGFFAAVSFAGFCANASAGTAIRTARTTLDLVMGLDLLDGQDSRRKARPWLWDQGPIRELPGSGSGRPWPDQ